MDSNGECRSFEFRDGYKAAIGFDTGYCKIHYSEGVSAADAYVAQIVAGLVFASSMTLWKWVWRGITRRLQQS